MHEEIDIRYLNRTVREWASHVSGDYFSRLCLFGSLHNKDGRGFEPHSDIDILAVFNHQLNSPEKRVDACDALRVQVQDLEGAVSRQPFQRDQRPILSILCVTPSEIHLGIHKTHTEGFWSERKSFANLRTGQDEVFSANLDLVSTEDFHIFRDIVSSCQLLRNRYLAVTHEGKREVGDTDIECVFPKEIARAAARLASLRLGTDDMDVWEGSLFLLRSFDRYLAPDASAIMSQLRDASVERAFRKRATISAYDQLLLSEHLFQLCFERLSEDISGLDQLTYTQDKASDLLFDRAMAGSKSAETTKWIIDISRNFLTDRGENND